MRGSGRYLEQRTTLSAAHLHRYLNFTRIISLAPSGSTGKACSRSLQSPDRIYDRLPPCGTGSLGPACPRCQPCFELQLQAYEDTLLEAMRAIKDSPRNDGQKPLYLALKVLHLEAKIYSEPWPALLSSQTRPLGFTDRWYIAQRVLVLNKLYMHQRASMSIS